MKLARILSICAISLSAVASTSLVLAAVQVPCGWFVEGVGGGSTSKDGNYGAGTSYSNPGVAWNVNAGYKIMPFFGLEGGVTSYANSKVKYAGQEFEQDRHWAYDVALRGTLPISDTGFEVFGKAGAARLYSSIKSDPNITITTPSPPNGLTNNSTSLFLGVGAAYYIMPTLAVNAQGTRVNGNSKTGKQIFYGAGLTWIVY